MADQLPPPTPGTEPPGDEPPGLPSHAPLPAPSGVPSIQTDFIPAGRGPIDEPARVAWWKRKLWKLPLAAWIVLVVALIAIAIVAAVGGDDAAIDGADAQAERTNAASDEEDATDESTVVDTAATEATTAATEPATTTTPTTTTPVTTTSTTTPTTTTQPERGTSPADAIPMGDPVLSAFTYAPEFSDAEWTGLLQGLVETGTGQFNDEPGRCVVLVGTLTPTKAEGAVSSGFNTPTVSMIVDGRLIDSGVLDCDTTALEANGYGWILDAEVTIGTAYPFFAEFFMPGDSVTNPEAVVLGSATSGDAIYFQPTILQGIPTPVASPGASSGQSLLPMGDPVQSAFTYAPEFSDAEWTGLLQGLVETGTGQFNDEPGRCIVLVGTLTPTKAEGAVSSGFNTPTVSMIVDGRLIDSGVLDCDTTALEANGYGWILDAEVTIGTAYPFFAEFFMPGDSVTNPEAVVLGAATDSDAIYFQPTILETIPTP